MTASHTPPAQPSAPATVVRRYRRLLYAYPGGSRRAELLDTLLLAAADEGRTRPGARLTVNLLVSGARARLGRPGSTAVVVLAVLVSLVAGLYTAAAASAIAWRVAAPPLPNAAQLAEIGEIVTPGHTGGPMHTDSGLFVTTEEGIRFDTVTYRAPDHAATDDVRGYSAAVQDRLESAGWDVRERRLFSAGVTSRGDAYGARATLTAARGDWLMSVETDAGPVERDPAMPDAVNVVVHRLSPWPVRAATLAGILPGLVLGWLLTGWVSRRTERSPDATGAAAVLALVPLLLIAINLTTAATKLTGEVWHGDTDAEPFWHYLVYSYEMGFIIVLATVLAAAILPIAALAPGRRART